MKKILTLIAVFTACLSLIGNAQSAFISNSGDNTVSVINLATNTVMTTIPVGSHPQGVSVSPDGSKVYVANYLGNSVSVIQTATNTVIATIPVDDYPRSIVVSPDGSKIYVVNDVSNSVNVIDSAADTVSATITVSGNGLPYGIAVSPDGRKVYVTNDADNIVNVIAAIADTVSDNIAIGSHSYGVAVLPNGSKVYVANNNTVSVIDTATNTVSVDIIAGSSPFGICVSPDGSKVYVTNQGGNSVSVINTASNSVTNTINVGSQPYGISVSPDGSRVFVANEGDNTVSEINTATNLVAATIPVGTYPIAFGNFIAPCPVQSSTITAGGNTTFCQGDSVVLTSSSATSYLWNNGSTDSSITVLSSGNYFATVTFINGCTATSDSITVTVHPIITDSVHSPVCYGSNFTFPDSTTITATVDTNQVSHLTSINSCDSIVVTILTILPLPSPTITSNGPDTFCGGDSTQLTASTGASYLWSNGATTQSIYASDSGNYTVTVTSGSGCTGASAATLVIVKPSPPVPTISVFVIHDTTILISSVGAGIQWEYDAPFIGWFPIPTDTNFISPVLIPGCYEVVATGADGCTSVSDSVCITSLAGLPQIITKEDISLFPNPNNGTFTLSFNSNNSQLSTGNSQLIITDVLGNEIYKEILTGNDNSISISKYSEGIYFYEIRMANESVRGKFVKE